MYIAPPTDVDYDKRWDMLLAMFSEERGWTEPGEREYPESDDSHCWPIPYTPVEGEVPGTLQERTLCGQVVVVEAVWTFGRPAKVVAPRIRATAGWLPSVQVVGGRIPNLRDEVFLPLATIAEDELPKLTTAEEVFEGGVQVMLEYDDLLARSALAGVQFLRTGRGTISTAATEVTEGALACAELSHWDDLEFIGALALQEIRWAVEIRRSYVWFIAGPADDPLSHVPGPVRLDLVEDALERLDAPRSRAEVAALPLRTLTLFEDAAPIGELDELRHRVNDSWRSFD